MLAEVLRGHEMNVEVVSNVDLALDNYSRNHYHLCIVDDSSATAQGQTLVQRMRELNVMMPILLLSVRQDKQDIVNGYETGCDEYITLPQSAEVIACKIRSWLRRELLDSPDKTYHFASFDFDTALQTLSANGKTMILSNKQSGVLRLLVENEGRVVDSKTILRRVWQDDTTFAARSLSVFVTKLRALLSEDKSVEIKNLRGKGYRLTVNRT